MWGAIIFDAFALPFAVGTAWYSIDRGRLVYRGTQHITRKEKPAAFWGWIAFVGVWSLGVLWLTAPLIFDGLYNT